MKPFSSWAEWPEGHVIRVFDDRPNCTDDGHDTREEADAVCRMLERDGLGGGKRIFPVRTWVEDNANGESSHEM